QLQCVSNDRMDRIPVLDVNGEQAFAEDLVRVVRLDTQSLSRVERSETFLQFAQDIFVHGITSSKPSVGSLRLCQTIPFGRTACFTERHGSFAHRRATTEQDSRPQLHSARPLPFLNQRIT